MSNTSEVPGETRTRVRARCLCLHTQRAARALARRFDNVFRPLGLTSGQFSLMMVLNQPEPPPMGRIAAFLAMDRTTLTAALKPLERRGIVEVRPHPTDRRSRVMVLTPSGRTLLAQAVPIWTEAHREVEALLGEGEADRLRESLAALA